MVLQFDNAGTTGFDSLLNSGFLNAGSRGILQDPKQDLKIKEAHYKQIITFSSSSINGQKVQFGSWSKTSIDRLLRQDYEINRLRTPFQNFFGRYPDLIARYQRSIIDILSDLLPI